MNKRRIVCWLAAFLLLYIPALSEILEITTKTLEKGMQGIYYEQNLSCNSPEAEFALLYHNDGTSGLPEGFKLSKSGYLRGIAKFPGTYVFKVAANLGNEEAIATLTLTISPFDQSALTLGGTDSKIIGQGLDSIVSIANAMQGGRAAMAGERAFVAGRKGYLYQSAAPFEKTTLRYKTQAYWCLDTLGDSLFYYNRYLYNRHALDDYSDDEYVMRIVEDPLGEKPRFARTTFNFDDVSCLTVNEQLILYIYNDSMMLLPHESNRPRALRLYHDGDMLVPKLAIPYKGNAFVLDKTGIIYHGYLDGQIAYPLTDRKATAFTLCMVNGAEQLAYLDKDGRIHLQSLHYTKNAPALDKIKAKSLNADENFLYYIASNNRPMKLDLSVENEKPTEICDFSADQLYVFDEHLILRKKGTSIFYIINKEGGDLIRLNKE